MNRLTRRQALGTGLAGLGYFFTSSAFAAARTAGANGRLAVVGIGVGGKGSSDISQAGSLMDVIALCDIDENFLNEKSKQFPQAKKFFDYRKLFDDAEILRNMDAVTISTPDHNHALPAAMAIRNKKHVYLQKPLTRTVFEAYLLKKLAKEYGVCTQMGNQGSAANGLRRAVELVQAGVLGPVKEVHVWTNRPIWPQAPKVMSRPPEAPVPAHVHWDEWIGTAPYRPYAEYVEANAKGHRGRGAYHAFAWRGWWDFGTGAIGDMACHTANMAFRALKLTSPTVVTADATDVNPETCPSSAHVTMQFPARDGLPPVTLHWYEGQRDGKKLVPPDDLIKRAIALDTNPKRKMNLVGSGSILVGEKGIAYSPDDYGAEVFFETGQVANANTSPEKTPVNNKSDQGQKNEWVEAIKANRPDLAYSNFDIASPLTAAFLLGNVAIRTGKAVEFDVETLSAKNNPQANAYIKTEYRKGWDMLEKA